MARPRHKIDDLLTARMGGKDGFEAMRRACIQLVAQLGPVRLPIKLAPLARLMGAKLDYSDVGGLGNSEAAIRFRDDQLVLWVSRERFEDTRTRKRARFSIAHELGHLLMFKMLGPEFLMHSEADAASYALTERLCDFAASQILMPRELLESAVKEREFTVGGLRAIEDIFAVSSQALLKAIAELFPAGAVLELRRFQRHPREMLEWRVWASSTASVSSDLSSWLPVGCTLKHIKGLSNPDSILTNEAILIRGLSLLRKKMKSERDAVLTRMDYNFLLRRELLPADKTQHLRDTLIQDVNVGRVLMLIAERGSFDAVWPEAKTAV